jgi:predicted ester cyclase
MTTDENKALVQHAYLDGMNTRDMSVIRKVFAPDYVNYFPAGQGELHGIEEFVQALDEFIGSFSDLVFTVEDILGEGDKVALRWSAVGVHTGDYRGIPPTTVIAPTGRTISFSATDIYQVANGQVVAEWNSLDGFDIVRQMTAP